jgi:hypothetical protein
VWMRERVGEQSIKGGYGKVYKSVRRSGNASREKVKCGGGNFFATDIVACMRQQSRCIAT